MKVDQYLQRIGIYKMKNNDLATLSQLQNSHMLHVPFENLDVMNAVPIRLNIQDYYKKIVMNHRGGFCYELNGLFNWLLRQFDYETTLVAASVKRTDGSWSMNMSHACLLVHLDVPYLVDVGFGDSVRKPLPLTGAIKEDVSGTYRMKKLSENIYDLQRKEDEWKTLFRLDITPRQLSDFKDACHFNQTSPDSIFTQGELISLARPDGRVTFSNGQLIIRTEQKKKKVKVADHDKEKVLQKYFNINLHKCK